MGSGLGLSPQTEGQPLSCSFDFPTFLPSLPPGSEAQDLLLPFLPRMSVCTNKCPLMSCYQANHDGKAIQYFLQKLCVC